MFCTSSILFLIYAFKCLMKNNNDSECKRDQKKKVNKWKASLCAFHLARLLLSEALWTDVDVTCK